MKATIQQGSFSVSVDSLGAQLSSIQYESREYLWQADARWWPRQAPVLFPIVGSLRDGRAFSAAGECHMGRHGVARGQEHRLVQQTADTLTYELTDTPDTQKAYPYAFRLNMSYRIVKPGVLENRFTVTNPGSQPLPFVVGGHPAFNVPAGQTSGETFEDYDLRFAQRMTCSAPLLEPDTGLLDVKNRVPLLENSDTLPLTHALFAQDALVFHEVPQNTVTLLSRKSGHGVQVDFPGFDYLGIWSAANNAPFVALEPWTGCSTATDEDDQLEHKRGMTLLAPGETFTRAFCIRVF